MSHYFINDKNLKENIKKFSYEYNGIDFIFESDSGLFSTGHVDFATDILLKNIPPLSGSLLDIGCGYGVIGIVLGKFYKLNVDFVDINEKALTFAKKNCFQNNMTGNFILSDSFKNIFKKYDTIIINPPIHAGKEKIFEIFEESLNFLAKEGKFYLIMQKKHGALSSIKKLLTIFHNVEIIYKKKGFFVICCSTN